MVAFLEVGFFPRVHTAIAEWLACMLFILPQKKRFGESSWQQIGCCIGFLALLLGLNLLNQQQSGLTWIVSFQEENPADMLKKEGCIIIPKDLS